MVLVCAPAGYGKTVLLADWARCGEWRVAWLSLDAGDNDPARFWRHAVAALDRARPGVAGRVGPLLGPSAPLSFDTVKLSFDTVKKHVTHILGKLGAANRTQAVARARALGLIP